MIKTHSTIIEIKIDGAMAEIPVSIDYHYTPPYPERIAEPAEPAEPARIEFEGLRIRLEDKEVGAAWLFDVCPIQFWNDLEQEIIKEIGQ